MRTNIVLDNKLVDKAFQYTIVKSKKELINLTLREFIQNHSRLNLKELKGRINFSDGYDYKKLRKGV